MLLLKSSFLCFGHALKSHTHTRGGCLGVSCMNMSVTGTYYFALLSVMVWKMNL